MMLSIKSLNLLRRRTSRLKGVNYDKSPLDGRHLVYFIYLYMISRGLEINSQCQRRRRGRKTPMKCPSPFYFFYV